MDEPTTREVERWVADLAEQVPHVEPPYAALLAAGRLASRRRHRRRTVVAVLAAAAAVLAVLVVPPIVAHDGHHRSAPPAGPVVPAGMKLVGAGGVAIAVPQSWGYDNTAYVCGARARSYSFLPTPEPPRLQRCHGREIAGPRLSIRDPTSGVDALTYVPGSALPTLPGLISSKQVAGRTLDVAQRCRAKACAITSVIRGSGVFFTVTVAPGRVLLARRIAGSLREIPPGDVALPPVQSAPDIVIDPVEYATRLAKLGLKTRFGARLDAAGGIDPSPPRTTPAVGTVVPRGTSVLIGDAVTAAPPGMVYVGAGGAAIAVPASWRRVSAYDAFCGYAGRPYVDLVDRRPDALCPGLIGARRQPHLDIAFYDRSAGTALPGPAERPSCADGECIAEWQLAGVTFTITVPGPQGPALRLITRVGATLVSTPAGMTAVPLWSTEQGTDQVITPSAYAARLRAAGLAPVVGAADKTDPTRSTPDQGRLVPVGSTVRLGRPPASGTIAPAGMRYVGRGGYEIAVPAGWTTVRDGGCGRSPRDTVTVSEMLLEETDLGCPMGSMPGSPSLVVSGAEGLPQQDVITRQEIAGVRVVVSRTCARVRCTQTWQVAGRVRFDVYTRRGADQALLRRIGATVSAVPPGYVVVPVWPSYRRSTPTSLSLGPVAPAAYASILQRAGLHPTVAPPPPAGPVASPAGGTVVAAGSDVAVPGLTADSLPTDSPTG